METELWVVRSLAGSSEEAVLSSRGGIAVLSLAALSLIGSYATGSSLVVVDSPAFSVMIVRFSKDVSRGCGWSLDTLKSCR